MRVKMNILKATKCRPQPLVSENIYKFLSPMKSDWYMADFEKIEKKYFEQVSIE